MKFEKLDRKLDHIEDGNSNEKMNEFLKNIRYEIDKFEKYAEGEELPPEPEDYEPTGLIVIE